ncbi:MAG: 4Fe-4S ferredoxin, iron-sulfur binding domain protein [Herbinix sp.]|nr:4Fe-4S ferredoxin, iron-sulfur binding domain protein [Herbinix sp.]
MEVYNQKQNCYGCMACVNVCPTNAIETYADKEGFLYPQVHEEQCIHCDRCRVVCPITKDIVVEEDFNQRIYAVKHLEESLRLKSTSGGMFLALSDAILEQGGVVYGAVLDESLTVVHTRATNKEERDSMIGSKYVQSNLSDIFSWLEADLKRNTTILFTGTPCQIAAIKAFSRGKNTSNLILCDIVCHGVASPLMWKEYISFQEKKKKSKLKYHYFRTKINGWHSMTSKNVYENGQQDHESLRSQLHMNLFLSDLILRPCCYTCKYSSMKRGSDITIGDYWGVENTLPTFDDNQGISLVLINTEKGNELFQKVTNKLKYIDRDASDCLQRNLMEPSKCPTNREAFWKDYLENGYVFILKKYAGYGRSLRIKYAVYKNLKSVKTKLKR